MQGARPLMLHVIGCIMHAEAHHIGIVTFGWLKKFLSDIKSILYLTVLVGQLVSMSKIWHIWQNLETTNIVLTEASMEIIDFSFNVNA